MLERIIDFYLRRQRKIKNQKLIKKGILIVGNNTNIENFEITFSTELPTKNLVVTIGDDCIINCKFIIYNSKAKVTIGNRVYIGPQTTFFCYNSISLKDDILLSWGITLVDTNAHSTNFKDRENDVLNWRVNTKDWTNVKNAPILIESKVWIGFNSIITKGITIGEYAIVGCGSVVVKDIYANQIVGGNPAVPIK